MEYCSVIWNPWQRTFIDKIEHVKKIAIILDYSSYLVGNIKYHCSSRSLRNYTPLEFPIAESTLGNTESTCDIFIGANTFNLKTFLCIMLMS